MIPLIPMNKMLKNIKKPCKIGDTMIRFLWILLLVPSLCIAQDQPKDSLDVEEITIVKPYKPSVSDAFKIKSNAGFQERDSVIKMPLEYTINSVPVASTFVPAKGKAKGVVKAPKEVIYENYASLGFGNYTTPLVELFLHTNTTRDNDMGLFLNHHSSQGGIKEVLGEDAFYDTDLDLFYSQEQREFLWKAKLGATHQVFHWYGLADGFVPSTTQLPLLEDAQTYMNFSLGGEISMFDALLDKGDLSVNYFTDAEKSSEIQAVLSPEFVFPVASELLRTGVEVNYISGSFDQNYLMNGAIKYNFLNLGVSPSFELFRDDLTVQIGAKAYFAMDMEQSDNNFYIYPNILASYKLLGDTLGLFGGVTGDLTQQSYRNFVQENPYVSPTLAIGQTDNQYKAFAGIKGKIKSTIAYTFQASYGATKNLPMYHINPAQTSSLVSEVKAYHLGNSFSVVYDDVTTIGVEANVEMEITKQLKLGSEITFNNYNTDALEEAINLPSLLGSVYGNYAAKKWYGGAKVFFRSNTKDFDGLTNEEITNDGFVDVNLNAGYLFSDRLSVFANANNILSTNYDAFTYYRTQGFQILGGLTYKFDF